jgi:hypothetical protein
MQLIGASGSFSQKPNKQAHQDANAAHARKHFAELSVVQ